VIRSLFFARFTSFSADLRYLVANAHSEQFLKNSVDRIQSNA